MTIEQYKSISAIISKYDAFIVDLWGVIHDGIEAYPGVNDCLAHIKEHGKKIVFLSNAPRRAFRAVEGLQRVGIPDDLYDHIITSGEITYEYVKSGQHGFDKKFHMIGPKRDAGLLDGTGYMSVESADKANFAIVTGFDNDESTLEDVRPQMEACLKNKLTMLCANPDIVIVRQSGAKALCAGAIAEEYQQMGGKIMQFGKPYTGVYIKCLEHLADIPKEKIAMIGDNLETDIKGANNTGIDSYLISGGILGEALGIKHGQLPDINKLEEICRLSGVMPKAVLPAFIWQ